MAKILLAGSTGYLGSYILQELLNNDKSVRIIVRNRKKLTEQIIESDSVEILNAELTKPQDIKNSCRGIDTVISTVGITKQKDGLTYMDVDYQANLNLLKDAEDCGVTKFIYVSVLNGDKLTHLKICQAKEKFVNALKHSNINHCIIRPAGFFSDMNDFYKMAQKGRVYLFGNGNYKMNPIHGEDLAKVCVDAVQSGKTEILVGGPDILTYNGIAKMAFGIARKNTKITHIPNWLQGTILFLLRSFTSSKTYGPVEFIMTVLTMDMVAPQYGDYTLEKFFNKQAQCDKN